MNKKQTTINTPILNLKSISSTSLPSKLKPTLILTTTITSIIFLLTKEFSDNNDKNIEI